LQLGISESSPLKTYRRLVGNATYHINTAVVGLEQLVQGHTAKPNDLTIRWDPPNDLRSAVNQSRGFILSAALILTISACDSYISDIARIPWMVLDHEQRLKAKGAITRKGGAEYSIADRLAALIMGISPCNFDDDDLKVGLAILELATLWRNAVVHMKSKQISSRAKDTLLANRERLHKNNGAIDIDLMLNHFQNNVRPTLKETTTIISIVSRFIKTVDIGLIRTSIPSQDAMRRILFHSLALVFDECSKTTINNCFVSDREAKQRRFQQALAKAGVTDSKAVISPLISLEEVLCLTQSEVEASMTLNRFPPIEFLTTQHKNET